MYESRSRAEKLKKARKEKNLNKLIQNESDGEESEHEMSYYIKDRVKLMKEVLKIMKPKKIKMMAPEFMKGMPVEEINSMLLEELLGISNKRLKYILEGKNLDEDSSSEEEEDNADVISLDDISDGELIILDSDEEKSSKKHRRHHHHHRRKIKEEPGTTRKIKKEKSDKEVATRKNKEKATPKEKEKEPMGEENLMSVLELLELQARARAIKSQLVLEAEKKQQEAGQQKLAKNVKKEDEEDDDEIIIEVPKNEEIVIPSESDSDEDIQFTEETTVNADKSVANKMENTPATAINEDNFENEDINYSRTSQVPETIQEAAVSNIKVTSANICKKNSLPKEMEAGASKEYDGKDLGGNVESEGQIVESKEDKSGESSEAAEIGDWEIQEIKLEEELKKLEHEKSNDLEHEKPGTSKDLWNSSESDNDTLAVIAEREKNKKIRKKKKKDKRERKSKKGKKKKNRKGDLDSEAEITCIEKLSPEPFADTKSKEECLSSEVITDNASDCMEKRQQENVLENKVDSDTEEGEVVTTSEEESEDSTADPSDFQGTVSEYKRLVEEAKIPPNAEEQSSTSELNQELLHENILDLEQKAEEKSKKLKEKRLRHIKGALESYKKDVGADSGSDKESEKGVQIIESVVIKPGIKINSKKLKRRVEMADNDEIVINVDQDDLDCIICD